VVCNGLDCVWLGWAWAGCYDVPFLRAAAVNGNYLMNKWLRLCFGFSPTNMVERIVVFARLAQLAERKALNLVVVGSSPTVGVFVQTGCQAMVAHIRDAIST
jgi:hypothetical protein